ncbi:MAG TPA: alcohol dehydrogenase catalytic domain-containing protein [Candidatus Dormibacteraeota bacterium]|nr:alcohol dehydrogenase catalytic domain-containing protein [Candidatus Dormibacteraeota bacterium]
MAIETSETIAVAAPPSSMWAMVLTGSGRALQHIHVPVPLVGPRDLLLRVSACGVCQLDRILVDGQLPRARYPVIPGHGVVGRVVEAGCDVQGFAAGQLVGVPRLGWACGRCQVCRRGLEHLCQSARLIGETDDGGMAEFVRADHRFCVHLPSSVSDGALATMLCEGATAYRALRVVGEAQRIGLYGSATAAGLAADLVRLRGRAALVALDERITPAVDLDAALVFWPAKDRIRDALEAVVDGGTVVWISHVPNDRAGISVPQLAGERRVRSVTGATRNDVEDLLALVTTSPVEPAMESFPMGGAEEALARLRTGRATAALVLHSL